MGDINLGLCVRLSVCNAFVSGRYLKNPLSFCNEILHSNYQWTTEDPYWFWGQKVKDQGHKCANSSNYFTFVSERYLENPLSFCIDILHNNALCPKDDLYWGQRSRSFIYTFCLCVTLSFSSNISRKYKALNFQLIFTPKLLMASLSPLKVSRTVQKRLQYTRYSVICWL